MCRKLFCLTSFVVVLWLVMGPSSAQGQEGLIGYWKLDETSGTTAEDSAGGDNNGTLSDNVEWQPGGGMSGGALLFDGTSTAHVEFPSTGILASSGTVAMWGYLPAPQPSQTRYFLVIQPSHRIITASSCIWTAVTRNWIWVSATPTQDKQPS